MNSTPIDWSRHDGLPESECYCKCHMNSLKDGDSVEPTFMSHTKTMAGPDGKLCHYSRKPCPRCGRHDNLARTSSGPMRETYHG